MAATAPHDGNGSYEIVRLNASRSDGISLLELEVEEKHQDLELHEQHYREQAQAAAVGGSVRGIICIALGSFSFSLMFLSVKWMADVGTFALVFYRSVIQSALALVALVLGWLYNRQQQHVRIVNHRHHRTTTSSSLWHTLLGPSDCQTRCYLSIRGSFGASAICAFYYGIQRLPLPDAVTLQFTTPPLAAAFAVCWVGEPWMLVDRIGALVCLVGVALIAHPTWLFGDTTKIVADGNPNNILTGNTTNYNTTSHDYNDVTIIITNEQQRGVAVLVTMVGAALAGLAYVSVRKIGHSAPAMVMVLYDGVLCLPIVIMGSGIIEGTLSVWNFGRELSSGDGIAILFMGVTAFGGQWFTNLGLQDETAATATLVTTTQIVWTFIFNFLFLSEPLNVWSLAGTGLILGYMLFVATLKMKQGMRTASDRTVCPTTESEPTIGTTLELKCMPPPTATTNH